MQNGCETLRVSVIRGSGHVWPDRIPGARYPEKVECRRVQIVGTPPPDDTERALLSGALHPDSLNGHAPQCYPDSLMKKHTTLVNITPRMIAYPIRICCPDHWLKWASLAIAHVPPSSDGVSGRPVRTSLPWIPKNSPQSRIALVIK